MSGFEVVTTFAGTVGWRMYCCIGRCKLPRHPGGLRALYPSQMFVLGYCVHEVFRANRLGWGGVLIYGVGKSDSESRTPKLDLRPVGPIDCRTIQAGLVPWALLLCSRHGRHRQCQSRSFL